MTRSTALVLGLWCVALLAPAHAGAAFTSSNSVKFTFRSLEPIEAEGTGCGSTATGTFTPPPGRGDISDAFGLEVLQPKVGDRDSTRKARATGVGVSGSTASITMVADGAEVCSAESETSELPPAQRPWSASFYPNILYDRRVHVRLRPGSRSKRGKLRPRNMRFETGDTLRGIRWKRFGGKTAIGTAKYRANFPGTRCTPKLCRGHGSRAKIKAYKVGRCGDTGDFEYTRMTVTFRGGLIFGTGDVC